MAAPDRQAKPAIYKTEQEVQNWSFDEQFRILVFGLLKYNPITNTVDRALGLDNYRLANYDDSSDPQYFGFLNPEGAYYVMKLTENGSAVDATYSVGATGYNFSNRASLSYSTFDNAF